MKDKWFNYRPICIVFAFLLLGSVFSFYILEKTIITAVISSIMLAVLIAWAIFRRKIRYVLIPIIAFVIAIGLYYLAVWKFNNETSINPSKVVARVYDVTNEQNGLIKTECDNCVFDGKEANANIILYIYDNTGLFENIETGSVIKFTPYKFYKSDLFYYELPNSNLYSNDLKFTASVLIKDVEYVKTDKNLSEKFKDRVKQNLQIGLTNENAEIAYSALFGDKDLLSESQYSNYKLAGIAHLLAVSGLHVGIVFAILNLILGLMKIKGWWKIGTISIFLILYAYLCGFSVSIIRASTMCFIMMLAKQVRRDYDSLNSLALSGIILLLINPFSVFDVGFLLSFSCVAGIVMFTPTMQKWLEKLKNVVPSGIVDAVAISVGTSVSIVFVNSYFFQTLNIISVIANVIIIPLFTIAFVCIFCVALISLLCSYFSYLLLPINYLINFINILANLFGNLSISNFGTTGFNFIGIIIYLALLLFASRFCVAKYKYKIITTMPMVALLIYCLL